MDDRKTTDRAAPANPPLSAPETDQVQRRGSIVERWLFAYAAIVLRNIVGWILILLAWPVGVALPGPGGIPMFLVGFALVSFPGKRRLTVRVLRGRPVPPGDWGYAVLALAAALLLVGVVIGYLAYLGWLRSREDVDRWRILAAGGIAALLLWWAFWRALPLVNWCLRAMPRIRRTIRPWMRRRGIRLLPPRRRRRLHAYGRVVVEHSDEIIELHERHQNRLKWFWANAKPWLRRAFAVAAVGLIVYMMLRPLRGNWEEVHLKIQQTNWWLFGIASVMFALFLFVFRSMNWRSVLKRLGHALPAAAAARIWITSELARYLPGVPGSCSWAADPRGHGLAIGAVPSKRVPETATLGADEKGTIQIADFAQRKMVKEFADKTEGVRMVLVNPSGRTFITITAKEQVKLWALDPAAPPQPLRTWKFSSSIRTAAFSPDGESLAVALNDGTVALLELPAERKK